MADMTALDDILNGAAASATPVQNNFQTIETYINGSELIRADGTKVMTADLDVDSNKIVNLADGSADDDAMAYGQRPRLIYQGSGTQATTTSTLPILIDTETFDIGTVGSVGSGTLTMPADGVYAFNIVATHSAGSGSVIIQHSYDALNFLNSDLTSGNPTVSITVVAFLAAADTFNFSCRYSTPNGPDTFTFIIRAFRLV